MSLYADFRNRFPDLVKSLENARATGRFAHSFLISSADAILRRDFAVVIATLACCRNISNGVPDLDCDCCRRLEAGIYPEFHTLAPVGKTYIIKVGDRVNPEPNTLRSFLTRFDLTASNAAPRKIGVIFDADRMNEEAQNALLKTLEEPPPDTTLILCTASPASLLPTTRSRCQIVKLPDGGCSFDFEGASQLFGALFRCCFGEARDLLTAEEAVQEMLTVSSALSVHAEEMAENSFADEIKVIDQIDDPVLMKRVEARRDDAAKGEYMRQRRFFINAIYTFCAQLYLLSRGVDFSDIPNPEVFDGMRLPKVIPESFGEFVLKSAEELESTLRFNVNEELALRSFAVDLTLFNR